MFTAKHAENAEMNPERKRFLCDLCALCGEWSFEIFRVPYETVSKGDSG
jgi:hypothetical protein